MRCNRKRNEDEDSPHKFYTLVTYVEAGNCKGEKTFILNSSCDDFLFNFVYRIGDKNCGQ